MTRAELVAVTLERLAQDRLDVRAGSPTWSLVSLVADMLETALSNGGISAPPPVQLVAAHSRRFIGSPGERACSGAGKPPTPTGVCTLCYQRQPLEIAVEPGDGVRHG